MATNVRKTSNYTMNLTAGGAFLLPHGDRDGGARVVEVGPPAAGYGERWAGYEDSRCFQ